MRIGYFTHSYHPNVGGIEAFAQGFARLAQRLGHEVHVYCPQPPGAPAEEVVEGVVVHRFPEARKRWRGLPFSVTRGMAPAARRHGLDLLHAFEYRNGPPLVAAHLRHRLKVPLVWSTAFHPAHRGALEPPHRWLYDHTLGRFLARSADVVAYLSKAELERLKQTHPAVARKPCLELPPVMPPRPPRSPTPPHPRPYAVTIGRLEPYKGARELIAAWNRVPKPLDLLVAGFADAAERATLERIAQETGVADRVKLLGSVPEAEKWRLLDHAKLFVQGSNYESFGISLVEALEAGTPTVTTPAGIAPELVHAPHQILHDLKPATIAAAVQATLAGAEQDASAGVQRRFGEAEALRRLEEAYALALRSRSR